MHIPPLDGFELGVLHDSETTVARNDIDRLPLLEAVERMEQVFVGPLNPEKEIELGLFKMRIPQYPIEGVREAVLNALRHAEALGGYAALRDIWVE